jgi:probable O-glycosylation ligase (exosortase A-associated)
VGLQVYICFALIKPEALWPWAVPEGNYSRIVGAALLLGWAIQGFGRWDLGRAKPVIVVLICYFFWIILSALQAPDQAIAWEYVERYAKIILPVIVGVTTITTVRQLKIVAWVILLSHAYPAFELNLTLLRGYNQLKEEGFGFMDNNCYAISLVSASGLAFFLFLHADRWWQKAVAAASAAVIIHAVIFSNSRGGMLGLIVMGAAAFAVMPKGPKEILIVVLAVVMALNLAGPESRKRFMSSFAGKEERDESAESRVILWSACWDTMKKNPVFGVGPNHMPLEVVNYGFKKGKACHSLWLELGAELGFPGLLLIISYYMICGVRLVPIALRKSAVSDPWFIYLARMVIASLCGFAFSAQFVSLIFLETPYYVAMLGAAILKLTTQQQDEILAPAARPAVASAR